MSSEIKIKDRNRSANRVVVLVLIAIIILFILIRVIAINANSNEGVSVIQPDLDSINLEQNNSKMAQFEKEHSEDLEKQYNESNENSPTNYNFKKMFGVTQTNTVEVIEKPVNKKIETNYELNNDGQKKQRIIKEKIVEPIAKEEVKEEVKSNGFSNPFGTVSSSKKNLVNQTSNGVKIKDTYKCYLHADQKIKNGGGVIFRAGEDIQLESRIIKKNSILYGTAVYQGQRVIIKVNRVKGSDGEYAVNLTVYDNDFVKGIFFKNAYDEISEKTTDDAASTQKQNNRSGLIGSAVDLGIKAGKNIGDAIKKERSLNLQEGYIIYIKEITDNEKNQ